MDAEAADRPGAVADGPHAGAVRGPVAAGDRLRAAVLAGSALTALVAGGWWWQTGAPATGPAAGAPAPSAQSRSGYVPGTGDPIVSSRVTVDGEGVVSVWSLPGDSDGGATVGVDPRTGAAFRVDPRTGAAFRVDPRTGAAFRVDPLTGAAFRVDSGGRAGVRVDPEARRLGRLPNTIWRERATLGRENGRVVKQAAGEAATRFLLQYRCTGPGELLVVLERIRAAVPFPTVGCDGTVVSIELTAAGGPFRVSLSTADAEPLRVDAQLVGLP
ncbi:hypothetical protein AB0L34_18330 [Micromonospora sp. NPDC052213]|uniref:hypothetical protein n=1 Tax=Micromonospora sp. NPDC052213 TaxID=3155812 RepID=UPI00343E57DA